MLKKQKPLVNEESEYYESVILHSIPTIVKAQDYKLAIVNGRSKIFKNLTQLKLDLQTYVNP